MPDLSSSTLIEVAVTLPIPQTLTYRVPESLAAQAQVGVTLLVPVGKRRLIGYLLGPAPPIPSIPLKEIIAIIDPVPRFNADLLPFYRWLAEYYQYPLGEVFKTALPGGIKAGSRRPEYWVCLAPDWEKQAGKSRLSPKAQTLLDFLSKQPLPLPALALREYVKQPHETLKKMVKQGLVILEARRRSYDPMQDRISSSYSPVEALSLEQEEAGAAIAGGIRSGNFSPFLLHGVTASGKTEVYLAAAQETLSLGRSVLVLVPEIALTHPIGVAFRQRFGPRVTLLHSGMSDEARLQQWRRISLGEIDIVVGARSAVFAPLPQLGLIVVDEEHDPAYKNEGGLPYQARDISLYRGRLVQATVVLGSATPAVASFYHAKQGKYHYLSLSRRVTPHEQPHIHLLNLKEYREQRRLPIIATPLRMALAQTLAKGEQALLFLNRRGYANVFFCLFCGQIFQCRACSVSLTLHREEGVLRCHYCGYSQSVPERCPHCQSTALKRYGLGTERLEKEVQKLFPQARVARLDRDTASTSGKAQTIFQDFTNHGLDILIGTQMISKGHNFPEVTLVGVIAADLSLYFPEYHAGERTFQLLAQVAGRAGRGDNPGQVIIQSFNPGHYALQAVQAHDYSAFYQAEIKAREELGYPPFTRLALIRLSGPDQKRVEAGAKRLAGWVHSFIRSEEKRASYLKVMGPVPAPLACLKGRYRWYFLLKSYGRRPLAELLAALRRSFGNTTGGGVSLGLDIDPVSME